MQAQQSGPIQQDTPNEQLHGNDQSIQENYTQAEGVVQPLYMFEIIPDQNTGQMIWGKMLPQYCQYFYGNLQIIKELRQTTNKKWTGQQLSEYLRFLNDLQDYIKRYIWTGQVCDFNDFTNVMTLYGQNQNKVGYQLYDIQLDYLQKLSSGYDFKLDKKKKKAGTQSQAKVQAKKPVIVQPKEEVIIRKGDPQINIQTLMNTQWGTQKYLNIDIFKKQSANLVFIGHVDAGKSTLTGNILKQLGEVDQQQWARNKQEAKENGMEAWQLAGISDVDPNQRKRGKTIECAKLMFSLQNRRFTLFDAPGHKNYVPNMIMGACQADIAVLIISAKEGQFQAGFQKEGQTKQHAMLAKALGVSGFLVAVTKMNTYDWDQKRYQHIKNQVSPFLQNSCGFTDVPFIPIDSINNVNIHKRIEGTTWYKGPSLLEYLNTVKIPERKPMAPLRIPLIDKFRQVGNLYVYGKIQSGTIIEDQTVTILPSRKQMVIKQIINAKDQRLPFAMAGENVKLKIKGIQQTQIKRGDIVCNNLNYCQETYQFKATLHILQIPENKKLMSSGYQCILHMHAITEQVEILKVEAKVDKTTKKNVVATFLKPGEEGTVVIKVSNMICLQKYDFMPSLGRFTLRDQGKTIGYGCVSKIKPAKSLLQEQKQQLGLTKEKQEAKKQESKPVEQALEQMTISQ